MNTFEEVLKKYLNIFAGQEMYFVNDTRNLELFKKNPGNTNAEDVRTKISAINDTELMRLSIMEEMIQHILKLSIDDRLQRGDLTLVDDIANITLKGEKLYLVHFASVYCNFHKPDLFPIYSEQHLDFYRLYIKENNLPLDPEKMNTYATFSQALQLLVERLGLSGKMNYLQLRKFGWLYAETILKEGR
ncbi:MAG: hypothetical protein JNM57_07790 [Cyclobacteriaceae bacterium]|nr:hypothetical protein [Cyclobacteriaceae bacterium]